MHQHVVEFVIKRPALSMAIGLSIVISTGLLVHAIIAKTFATDFSVYWRTANDPAVFAYRPRTSLPFPYPPTMLLWIAPLAFMPMWIAFGLWVAVSIAAIVLATRSCLRLPAIGLLLISPPIVYGLLMGQVSGALSALLIWACGMRNRVAAGLAFAVIASIKPQLVIAAPFFLLLKSDIRALVASIVAFAFIVGASIAVFGFDAWLAWKDSLGNFHSVLHTHNVLGVAITPAASAEYFGLPPLPFLFAGMLTGAWLITRFKCSEPFADSAVIATASLLSAPYALTYDLASIAPFLVTAIFANRISAGIALGGTLNPLPLLLTARLLLGQASQAQVAINFARRPVEP